MASPANSYQTIESLTYVLPSGATIDTAAPDADDMLCRQEPRLCAELAGIRDEIRASPAQRRTLAAAFSIKNTMGYGLNAFLDHDRVTDILTHLLIGSEGTLAFVAEAVLRTVPLQPAAATDLLLFGLARGRHRRTRGDHGQPAPALGHAPSDLLGPQAGDGYRHEPDCLRGQ